MARFQDRLKQNWEFELTLASLKSLEDIEFSGVTDVEFIWTRPPTMEMMHEMMMSPIVAGPIVWVLVRDNLVGKKKVDGSPVETDEDFYSLLGKESIDAMTTGLLEEVGNFFPALRISIQKLIQEFSNLTTEIPQILETIPLIDRAELEASIKEEIKRSKELAGISGPESTNGLQL